MDSMSKKSKHKKTKPHEVSILKASDIESYIRLKYEVDDNGFWTWFFHDCPLGETRYLGLRPNDYDIVSNKLFEYYKIIVDDFILDADEEGCLEIENDL
jgi:hypothetical protein